MKEDQEETAVNELKTHKKFLRIPEAKSEYGLGEPLLRKLIRLGRIPSVRPAGARIVLIPREALEKMMADGKK